MAESRMNRAANGKNNAFKKTPAISFQCQFQASSGGLRNSSGDEVVDRQSLIMAPSSSSSKVGNNTASMNNGLHHRYSREELVDIRNQQFQRAGIEHQLSSNCGESFDDSDSAIASLSSAMALKIPLAIRRINLSSSTSSNGDDPDVLALLHQQQLENGGNMSPTADGELSPTAKNKQYYSRKELVLLRESYLHQIQGNDADEGGNIQNDRHHHQHDLMRHGSISDECEQRFLSVIPPEIRRLN